MADDEFLLNNPTIYCSNNFLFTSLKDTSQRK